MIALPDSRLEELQRDVKQQIVVKKMIFNFAAANIFAQSKRIDVDKPIVVCGQVCCDGKGDYFHMLSFAKHIRKQFPNIPLELIVMADLIHKGKLIFPQIEKCNTYIHYEDEPEGFIQFLNEKIAQSSIWISGPIEPDGINYSDPEISEKGIAISEYDAASNGSECDKHLQMGLSSKATGIFLSSKNEKTGWFNLKNQPLKDYLWKKEPLNLSEINPLRYNSTNQLFVFYRKDMRGLVNFVTTAINFADYTNKEVIDICIFSSEFFKEIKKENLFSTFPISEIKFVSFDGNEPQEEVIKIHENGKTLRLIFPDFLEKKDFKLLMKLSAPIVGCTGDGSLSDVISLGKIPFYEVNKHKLQLFHEIKLISQKVCPNSPLTEYFNIPSYLFSKPIDLNHVFDWSKLIEQARSMSEFVKKERQFKPFLTGAVNEALYRQNSNFAKDEDNIKWAYVGRV